MPEPAPSPDPVPSPQAPPGEPDPGPSAEDEHPLEADYPDADDAEARRTQEGGEDRFEREQTQALEQRMTALR
jgi:hypothetical protein